MSSLSRKLLKQAKQQVLATLRPVFREYGTRRKGLEPGHWDLEVGEEGLSLEGLSLEGLARWWGSPLHVVHAARLDANAERFQHRPPERAQGCEVFYSYKTNPIPAVLRRIHARGVGAEVISPYELWLALRLGVPPERIIYNGPAKPESALREAISRDIFLLNLNHREEVAVVARLAEELGRRPTVGIRVTSRAGWRGQFGIPLEGDRALRAYEEALACRALRVVAVHAHLGLLIRDSGSLERFVQEVLAFCDTLYERLGLEVELLDLGGSLGIPSVAPLSAVESRFNKTLQLALAPPEVGESLSIEAYVAGVLELTEEHFRRRGRRLPRILLEPGRALTGNTQLLLTRVVSLNDSGDGLTYAILDAGQNLAESARGEYHQLFLVKRHGEPARKTYALVGPICSPGDVLRWAVPLPTLEPGDTLAIMDAGAYFVPFSTSFSFPQPGIVLLDGGRDTLVRRAETFEDVVMRDVAASD